MDFIIWDEVKDLLATEISESSVHMWFDNVVVQKEDSFLYIIVEKDMQAQWMSDKYTEILERIIRNLTGESVAVKYIVRNINQNYEYKPGQPQFEPAQSYNYTPSSAYNEDSVKNIVFKPKNTFQS